MHKRLLIVFAIFSCFFACTKIETTEIGSGLIPAIDGVITKDTSLPVFATTFVDDNIARVYKGDDHVIGVISNDPLFGKTTASAFFEIKPVFYPFYFPGNKADLSADSIDLVMSYTGVYGDSTIPQTWRVFEINNTSKLKFDSLYGAQTDQIGYGSQLGVRTNINITTLNDSVHLKYEDAKNQIRIRLNKSFADRLLQYDSTNAYKSDSMFRESFAGFAVVPDQGSGNALVQINLLDSNTKLALYHKYKVEGGSLRDTVTYFRFNQTQSVLASGNANLIKREYAGSEVAQYLKTTNNDSNFAYVQTSPGTYVKLNIPGLSGLSNRLVHRAELSMYQAPANNVLDNTLSPPVYLLLAAYDSVSKMKRNVPNDYIVDPSTSTSNINTFGGRLRTLTVNMQQVSSYSFDLTRYVQGIATRKDTSYTLLLSAPSNDSLQYHQPYPGTLTSSYHITPGFGYSNNVANGRVRLAGSKYSDLQLRMRLRIIYSLL